MANTRFYETLSEIASFLPEVTVDQYDRISNSSFRILAHHPDVPRKLTVAEYIGQVESALGDNFEVVADSIQPLNVKDLYGSKYTSMIVQARRTIEDFKPEEMEGKFRSVTANIFADREDVMWKVVEADGKKVLVQTESEDYEDILNHRMNDRPVTTVASFSYNGLVPGNGDFAMFYNPENFSIEAGLAAHIDGNIMVATVNRPTEWTQVKPAQVIETVLAKSIDAEHSPLKGLNEIVEACGAEPSTNEFSSGMASSVLNFYSTLFGGSDFFKQLIQEVAQRRDFGKTDRPLIQTRY